MRRPLVLFALTIATWVLASHRTTGVVLAATSDDTYCGDGICQQGINDPGCYPGGGPTPGNGCEEDASSCPADCDNSQCGAIYEVSYNYEMARVNQDRY